MVNIDNAINYPFKDKNWKNTLGIYFLIAFVLELVSNAFSFSFQISNEIAKTIETRTGTSLPVLTSLTSGSSLFVSLLLLPVSLYLAGYVIDMIRQVMKGNEQNHPEHGDVMARIKTGLAPFTFGASYMILMGILGCILLVPLFTLAILKDSHQMISLVIIMAFIFSLSLFSIFAIGIAPIIVKTMSYIFVKENSISAAFNFTKIFEIIKRSWKKLYFLYLVDIILGLVALVSILSCCLAFIVTPILTSIVVFIKAYVEGNIFRQINEESTVKSVKIVRKVVAKKKAKK